MIPMENELVSDDNGKKRVVARKVFPGYVLVEMIVDDRTWYIVRNTPCLLYTSYRRVFRNLTKPMSF